MTSIPRGTILAAGVAVAAITSATAAEPKPPKGVVDAGELVFRTYIGFLPGEMLDPENEKSTGIDIAAAKAMGVASEHKNISFDGLISELQAGQRDAVISGLDDRPERRQLIDFVNYAETGDPLIVKSNGAYDRIVEKRSFQELVIC